MASKLNLKHYQEPVFPSPFLLSLPACLLLCSLPSTPPFLLPCVFLYFYFFPFHPERNGLAALPFITCYSIGSEWIGASCRVILCQWLSIWTPILVPTAPLPVQFPAMAWESRGGILDSHTHVGELKEASGSQLHTSPVLDITGIWKIKDFSLFLCLFSL